jgi:hypothetical protein
MVKEITGQAKKISNNRTRHANHVEADVCGERKKVYKGVRYLQ